MPRIGPIITCSHFKKKRYIDKCDKWRSEKKNYSTTIHHYSTTSHLLAEKCKH